MKINQPTQQPPSRTDASSPASQPPGKSAQISTEIQLTVLKQKLGEIVQAKILSVEVNNKDPQNAAPKSPVSETTAGTRDNATTSQAVKAADLYRMNLLNKSMPKPNLVINNYINQGVTAGQELLAATNSSAQRSQLWTITLQLAGLAKPVTTEHHAAQLPAQWLPGQSLTLRISPTSGLHALLTSPSPEDQALKPILQSLARFLPLQGDDLKTGLQTLLSFVRAANGITAKTTGPQTQPAVNASGTGTSDTTPGMTGTSKVDTPVLAKHAYLRQTLEMLLGAPGNSSSIQRDNAGQPTTQGNQQAIPPLVKDLLSVLSKAILTPAQSQDPVQLKAGLRQSGMAMEAALLGGKLNSGQASPGTKNAGDALSASNEFANNLAKSIGTWLDSPKSTRSFAEPGSILNSPLLQTTPADLKALLLTALATTLSHLRQNSANHTLPTNWESLVNWLMPRTSDFQATGHPLHFPGNIARTNRQPFSAEGLDAGELLRALAQTIARIQVNQSNALQQNLSQAGDQPPNQVWLAELPILGKQLDTLQMRLEKEPKQQGKGQQKHQWKLTLAFDFEGLGSLQSHVIYTDGTVSATFWADQMDTLKLLNEELPKLRKGLKDWGVAVGEIKVRKGHPPPPPNPISHQLLDERV